jgi:hypothetical protein
MFIQDVCAIAMIFSLVEGMVTIVLDLYRGGSIFQKPFACFCVTAL